MFAENFAKMYFVGLYDVGKKLEWWLVQWQKIGRYFVSNRFSFDFLHTEFKNNITYHNRLNKKY